MQQVGRTSSCDVVMKFHILVVIVKIRGVHNPLQEFEEFGFFSLSNLTVVSKRKECVGKKNILGTYIVGNK